MKNKTMYIDFEDTGTAEYKTAWDYQEKVHSLVLKNREQQLNQNYCGILIFCEHPHVYTLGKSGLEKNLLINPSFLEKIHASFYRSNRGGDITYHGPGQIVGYPVFDLQTLAVGVKDYIHRLEEVVIQTLAVYEIKSSRVNGSTGVWIDKGTPRERKICAIGVRVSKAVTMHGFALNVNTSLEYFSYINPCGMGDKGVTSMEKELGKRQNSEDIKIILKKKFEDVFAFEIRVRDMKMTN